MIDLSKRPQALGFIMKTHWKDIESPNGGWQALNLRVTNADKPGLRLQTGANGRIKLSAGEQTVFWACIAKDYAGVWLLRAHLTPPETNMPVAPIRSGDIEKLRTLEGEARFRAWSRYYAQALIDSPLTPLYDGEWFFSGFLGQAAQTQGLLRTTVSDARLACTHIYAVDKALKEEDLIGIDWGINGSGELIGLKPPQPEDSGRLKWWRKLAREDAQPPVLVQYLSCLDAYIIIDGHVRLQAALLEGRIPDLIVFYAAQAIEVAPDAQMRERIWAAMSAPRSLRKKELSTARKNEILIQAFDDRPYLSVLTRAWATLPSELQWIGEVRARLEQIGKADQANDIIERR